MEVSNEQRQQVRLWVAAGAGLSEVQKRLKDEFGLSLTYMDVRFLVLDLGAQVKDKPEPRKPPANLAGKQQAAGDATPAEDAVPDDAAVDAAGAGAAADGLIGGKVSVTLDRIVRPGAMVSGAVTFSDGTHANWVLDQTGRLALEGATPGYRPAPEDVQAFQNQLRELLQTRGY